MFGDLAHRDSLFNFFDEINNEATNEDSFYLLTYLILTTPFPTSSKPNNIPERWEQFGFFYEYRPKNLSKHFLRTYDYVVRHLTKDGLYSNRSISISFVLSLDPGLVMVCLKGYMKIGQFDFLNRPRYWLKTMLAKIAPQLGPWHVNSSAVGWLAIRIFFGMDDIAHFISVASSRNIHRLDVNSFLEFVSKNKVHITYLLCFKNIFIFIERVE